MKNHPYADLFPMLGADQLAELAEDIRAKGLLHPVVTYRGLVLDGRNRWAACKKLKMGQVETVEYDGTDPLGYVVSANFRRRDLTTSQRAMIANDIVKAAAEAGAANLRQHEVARALQVSERSMTSARVVTDRGTDEEVEAVKGGTRAVSRAAKEIERKEREIRDAAAADPGRFQPFADRLAAGEKAAPVHKAFAKEKNRQTTKGEALKDATGHEVPANLRDLFGDPWLMQTAEAVEKIAREALKSIGSRIQKKGPAFAWLVCGELLKLINRSREDLTAAHGLLADARPHAVHRACAGKGCGDCRNAGWIPAFRFKELRAEGKA